MDASSRCDCGSGRPFEQCCGPLLGGQDAETAEALMRSRYCAYARQDLDYVVRTHDPQKRSPALRDYVGRWAASARFTALKILETEAGGPTDQAGFVTFEATYVEDGETKTLRERSRFRRLKRRWVYVEGAAPKTQTTVRHTVKVGRNDPCPCGSGKKHKRCCG